MPTRHSFDLATLENGIRVWHAPSKCGVLYLEFTVLVGFQNEVEDGLLEFCHANEHMAAKWTSRKFPNAAANTEFFTQNSIETNAFTTVDMTGYHMRGLCEFAKPMIDRFCATFAEPAYDHRVFDAEMAAVQNELGNIVNGEWHTLDEAIAGVLYAGTPLAAGERAKIANVQRLRDGGETGMQMLLGWRNTSYHPGLCSVSVFGDCPAYLLDTLKKRLSTIKGAVRELPCISNDSRVLSRQRDVLAADARYDSFHRIVFMFPLEFSTFEYEPRAAVECLSYVLSSGLGSRLYRELRTKRKLVYSVGSAPQLFVCAKMKSYFCIDTKFQVTDGDVAAQRRKVKDGVFVVLRALGRGGVTDEEMGQWKIANRTAKLFARGEAGSARGAHPDPNAFFDTCDYAQRQLCFLHMFRPDYFSCSKASHLPTGVVSKLEYLEMRQRVTKAQCRQMAHTLEPSKALVFASDRVGNRAANK